MRDEELRALFAQNLTSKQLQAAIDLALQRIYNEYLKARDPEFDTINLGNQPYMVNYKNRKHLFAFNTATSGSITLTSSDGYGVVLPAQTWTNLGFPDTTRLVAPSGQMVVKATDEIIP